MALFACYLRQSRTIAVGSDGASQALQAWDLLHGNVLLHGWWVTDVSFYTTELPQYAAIELAGGLSADVMHVAGALTYTLLVLAAAFLARGRATGRAGLPRALLAGGIMLAPELGAGTQTLVLSPDHTGTAVPLLLIWLLIDRAPHRWYGPPLVWLGLTWTAVADPMTVFVAVIPLAAVCAFRVTQGALANRRLGVRRLDNRRLGNLRLRSRARQQRAPRHAETPLPRVQAVSAESLTAYHRPNFQRCWSYDVALLTAAVLAIPAELAATALIKAAGGWQVHGLATSLGGAARLAGNARLAGQGLLLLFGGDVFGAGPDHSALAVAFAVIHLAGLALAAAGIAVAFRRLTRRTGHTRHISRTKHTKPPRRTRHIGHVGSAERTGRITHTGPADLIESILLAGIAVDLAGYLLGVQAVNILSTREIAPILPFAAVLAGRMFGPRLAADRPRRAADRPRRAADRPRPGRALRCGLVAVLALYAAMLGYGAAQPPAAPQYADLAAWLTTHHWGSGLSGYHQANIVTLESGGAVTLRAVAPAPGGGIGAYTWNASQRWFDPAAHSASFLVLTAPGLPAAAGGSGLTMAEAVATFGRPAQRYRYHAYIILIWPRGENLLARLR